jgi:hypothetical protein
MDGLTSSSLRTSADFTKAIFDNYYPAGRMVVKNTSSSKDGVYGRTLTSRTLSDSLSGDSLYRSPKFAQTFYNKIVGSSLNSLITHGSESVFNSPSLINIANPESSGEDSESTTISGGAAFNRIIAQSAVGLQGGMDFVSRSSTLASIEMSNASTTSDYINGKPHGSVDYITDPSYVTSGSRTVALDSNLSPEEKNWIIERGRLVKELGIVSDSSYLVSGFNFDIPNSVSNLTQTDSFYEGVQKNQNVEDSIIKLNSEKGYICPAVIELLYYLSSKMELKGGLGVFRASDGSTMGPNLTPITSGNSVSDHIFGRAFDISYIGSKPGTKAVAVDFGSQGTDVSKYREGLTVFLDILNGAPRHLMPDLIVISPDLNAEYGIVSGNEPIDSPIKTKYPNLKYVNFNSDPNHRSHIHLSFSSQRSGQYVGPGGALGPTGTFVTTVPGGSFQNPGGTGALPTITTNMKKNFVNDRNGQLEKKEIFDLLRSTIMSDEAAAIFCAVAVRESGTKPASLNPDTGGGDWSVGLFQCNLLTKAHGGKDFFMPIGPAERPITRKGWQLGIVQSKFNQYNQTVISQDNFNSMATWAFKNLSKSQCFDLVDPILWIPYNQAYLVYTVIANVPAPSTMTAAQKLGATPETGYIFWHWGDYGGGPPYGFISNVKFVDAINIYKTTGKNPKALRDWTLQMFRTSGTKSKSVQYANKWVNGTVFPVSYKNRKWITESPKEPSGDIYAGLPDGNYNINPIRTPGVTPNLPASTAAAFAWAESQIGAPYAAVADYRDGDPPWPSNGAGAGATIKGFRGDAYTFSPGTLVYDCSGFVIAVYKKKGIDFVTKYQIWRSDQFNNPSLQDVEEADLQPLDIIVYKPSATNVGHVVMFHSRNSDGTINVIEATAKNGVTIGPLKPERVIARKRVDA